MAQPAEIRTVISDLPCFAMPSVRSFDLWYNEVPKQQVPESFVLGRHLLRELGIVDSLQKIIDDQFNGLGKILPFNGMVGRARIKYTTDSSVLNVVQRSLNSLTLQWDGGNDAPKKDLLMKNRYGLNISIFDGTELYLSMIRDEVIVGTEKEAHMDPRAYAGLPINNPSLLHLAMPTDQKLMGEYAPLVTPTGEYFPTDFALQKAKDWITTELNRRINNPNGFFDYWPQIQPNSLSGVTIFQA